MLEPLEVQNSYLWYKLILMIWHIYDNFLTNSYETRNRNGRCPCYNIHFLLCNVKYEDKKHRILSDRGPIPILLYLKSQTYNIKSVRRADKIKSQSHGCYISTKMPSIHYPIHWVIALEGILHDCLRYH